MSSLLRRRRRMARRPVPRQGEQDKTKQPQPLTRSAQPRSGCYPQGRSTVDPHTFDMGIHSGSPLWMCTGVPPRVLMMMMMMARRSPREGLLSVAAGGAGAGAAGARGGA